METESESTTLPTTNSSLMHEVVDELKPPTTPTSPSPNPSDDVEVSPKIRSVSMSHNLALSVVDEVGHMIHPSSCSPMTTPFDGFPDQLHTPLPKKSSSTSSLTRLESENPDTSTPSLTKISDSSWTPPEASFSSEILEDDRTEVDCSQAVSVGAGATSVQSSVGLGKSSGSNSSTPSRSDVLIGIVVSRWDNIVGPQCIYLWTEEKTSTFYPSRLPNPLVRHVKYVTDHTVDHHDVDGNLVSPTTIRSALCLIKDLDLAYLSLSIRVPSSDSINSGAGTDSKHSRGAAGGGDYASSGDRPAVTVPHAVAVLARLKFFHHFLLMRPLISNWLAEFSPKIGVLLCKNELQSSMINSWCAELCKTMTALCNCWWQQQQRFTLNSSDSNDGSTPSPSPATTPPEEEPRPSRSAVSIFKRKASKDTLRTSKSEDIWDYLPPRFNSKVCMETILTSHLSTSGTSIVVGSDVSTINQVIRFLLCFSKVEEGYCSRYVLLPTLPDTFMKGIFVQGLVFGEIGEKSISVNQVSSNLHPSTHIEINGKNPKVRQNIILQHKQRRETTLIQELTSLWNSSPYTSPPTELFPQQVKEVAGFVSKFLNDLSMLKPERRFARLLLFRRTLHAKVISLITYLHSIRLKPEKEMVILLKNLKDTLRMDEAEYLIVQVAAEKIRPGVLAMIRSY